jgi:hypothetical protein
VPWWGEWRALDLALHNRGALLKIIESGEMYATQVSCLNDSTEMLYAEKSLKDAFLRVGDAVELTDIEKDLLEGIKKNSSPRNVPSRPYNGSSLVFLNKKTI